MSVTAIIAPVVNVRPHSNADKLNLATVMGHQVVLGKDTQEGTLGVFFPVDSQLSHDMCLNNSLYRKHPETGEPMGGFFDQNRRVRAQKFRGEKSEGYWTQLGSLSWTGADLERLETGFTFEDLSGKPVCNKYVTPATRRAMRNAQKLPKAKSAYAAALAKHFDTKQLRYYAGTIPKDAVLTITEKIHGTSGRTGNVLVQRQLRWYERLANRMGLHICDRYYEVLSGTRNVVINPETNSHPDVYRTEIHSMFKALGLAEGETVYYEVIGYGGPNNSIMPAHNVEDPETRKRWGAVMDYSYGCDRTAGTYAMYVYRMTMTSPSGQVVEYSWPQICARARELGLKVVPQYRRFIYDGDPDALIKHCLVLADGVSALDERHTREGVCIRVESPTMENTFKLKGWVFCDLEGIAKNSDTYVDPEEIS